MTTTPLLTAAALRAAGRQPPLPFRIELADGRELTMCRLLRVLPAKRLVGEATLDGRRVLAKLFIGRRSESRWQQERRGLEALAGSGVPTPALLAAVAMVAGGHALMTDFLDPAESLAEAWARAFGRAAGDAEAMALLEPALAMLGRLHSAGLVQEDLHLGNFLRHEDKLFLLDGDAVRVVSPGMPLPAERAGANLAVFLAQLPPAWDGWAAALLVAYGEAFRGQLPHLASLEEEIVRVRNWRLRDFLTKTVRDCSLFAVEQTTTRFSAVWREAARQLAPVLASPDDAIDSGCVFKDGGTTTVARVRVNGRELLIKRYNLKSIGHALGRAWRPSRAWHSWQAAHRLRFLGMATPAPLALIEERFGPLRRRAWLISDYCPGPNLLHHLAAEREPPTAEAQAITILFEALHRQRISHGDLKATNLLWDAGRVLLIDLDAVVQHRSQRSYARAWRRDRARLLRNWPADSPLQRWLDRSLPAARESPGF